MMGEVGGGRNGRLGRYGGCWVVGGMRKGGHERSCVPLFAAIGTLNIFLANSEYHGNNWWHYGLISTLS